MDRTEREKWIIYNHVDLDYHINNFNLKRSCVDSGVSVKQYKQICKELNQHPTNHKKGIFDGRTFYYVLKKKYGGIHD